MAQKPKIVVWDDTIKYRELPTEFLVSEIRDYSDAKNEFFVSCNEVPKTDLGLSKNKNEIENMKAAFQYGKKITFTPEMVAIARVMYGTAEEFNGEFFSRRSSAEAFSKKCLLR